MEVFGAVWKDHAARIRQAWLEVVGEDDVVLMPGDLSWAMRLPEAAEDLAYLGRLPGRIVLIRGNHDYWWQSIGRVRQALPPNVHAVQNDHYALAGGWAVCGSRGWDLPGSPHWTEHDQKIFERELQRLELSLDSARRAGLEKIICMLHYPPSGPDGRRTPFTDLLEANKVRLCVYGHLHGEAAKRALVGTQRGVEYRLVACDAIGFRPAPLMELD